MPKRAILILTAIVCMSGGALRAAWIPVGIGGGGAQYGASISPLNPNLRFIACDMSGWYRSTDGGATWGMIDFYQLSSSVDYNYNNVCGMAFHPSNPNQVYGWGNQADSQSSTQLLLQSADAGLTWTQWGGASPPWGADRVTKICLDRGSPNLVLIGTDSGVFRSANNGASFVATSGSSGYITGLVIDQGSPVGGRVCYAGSSAGVFKSADGGQTWTPANSGLSAPADVMSLAGASTASASRLWAVDANNNQIYTSTNAAAWTLSAASSLDSFAMVASADSDTSTAYAINPNNRVVWKTADGGASWNTVFADVNPMPNAVLGWIDYDLSFSGWGSPATGVAVDGADANRVMSTDLGENFISDDGGAHWQEGYSTYADTAPEAQGQKWASRGLEVTSVFQYAVDPNNANYHYLCASDIGFCYSADAGATWHNTARRHDATVPSAWTETFYQVAANPVAGTLFAAVSSLHDLDHSNPLGRAGSGGVLKSVNYGATWTNASTGLPTAGTSLATSIVYDAPNATYYVAQWGQGVYKSTNNGAGWTACAAVAIGGNRNVYSLKLAGGKLFCLLAGQASYANPGGIFVSPDGGASWTNIATAVATNTGDASVLPLYYPTDFDVNPADPNNLYVAAQDFWSGSFTYPQELQGGCYRSVDGGAHWTRMAIPVPAVGSGPLGNTPYGYAPSIDPGNTLTAYYGTENQGFFKTLDGGATWARVTDLPFSSIQHVNFGAGNVYVGTFGGGVWKQPWNPAATATPSPSPAAGSPSATGSPTATRTATSSATRSPTATLTLTLSAIASLSSTASPSLTSSADPSQTPPSGSATVSPTVTATFSTSPTPSATPSPSATATLSASPSVSATPSPSPTSGPSDTASATRTATPSASPTFSPGPSATLTASASVSPSPGNGGLQPGTPGPGPGGLGAIQLSPLPVIGRWATLHFLALNGGASAEARVYDAAFHLVARQSTAQPFGAGWSSLKLDFGGLGNGDYFVVLTLKGPGGTGKKFLKAYVAR